jgi:transcription initiation factor TFIIB
MDRSTRQCERNTETQQPAQAMRDEQICPECDADESIHSTDKGELICDNCGLILENNNIDRGPEWRAFTHSDRQQKSRVGAPTTRTMHDKGLTTQIGQQDKDGYGRSLSAEERLRVNRLRKWHKRIRTKNAGEQNLQHALGEIDRMAGAVGVPQSVQEIGRVGKPFRVHLRSL